MNEVHEILVDGETLLNRWTGLKRAINTRIYVSASNFLFTKTLLGETMEALRQRSVKEFNKYIEEHKGILSISQNNAINNAFADFLNNTNVYMNTITISKAQNLTLVIFKGYKLDIASGEDLVNFLDETIAFAQHKKEENKPVPLFTMNNLIWDFYKEFGFNFDIRDAR